jgi:hypothetical protein
MQQLTSIVHLHVEEKMEHRRLVLLGIVTALLALGLKAQESDGANARTLSVFADLKSYENCNMKRFEKNFLGSLNYADCNEIVECGLAQVVMIKLAQPETGLKTLKRKIDELIVKGETPDVRYKAYLTSAVFERPLLFSDEKYGMYVDGDELFTAIALKLQRTLLAEN